MSTSFLAKCKTCKAVRQLSASVASEAPAVWSDRDGRLVSPKRRSWKVESGIHAGHVTNEESPWNGKWQLGLACPGCKRTIGYQAVAGTVTRQVCSEKCVSSTGFRCECSCGGRNHGQAHAA